MLLTPGAQVGPYVIRSLLGSGGMGDVYLAHDDRLDRDVALKLLPPAVASDGDRLRRFELEARAASALNHPAIVAIYDLGQVESQSYISMEFVQGQTLRAILQAGALPPRRALQVAAPIADGLAKAHEAGIVHRDLKPENLMVSVDGFAKILDFGLAKLSDDAEARAALHTKTDKGTRPGSVMGTVGYMSPEQASGDAVDYRSDQFSFGLVLYETLTGRRAFERATPVETMSAIIRDEPPPIEQFNPSVPAPVRWIVDRCLAKNPAERYASTRDLARDLASARDHFSELTGSGASAAVATAAAVVRVRKRELVAWGLVGALGIAALVFLQRSMGDTTPTTDRSVRLTIAPPRDVNFTWSIGNAPFAVSPDGRHLAFTGIGADKVRRLWIRSFDSLESRQMPATEGAFGPFWSPDSQTVGFFTATRLKRIPMSGGDAVVICEARFGAGGSWNRDDVILFAPSIDGPLLRVLASGGTPTPVTALDSAHGEGAHAGPVFLPDGRRFLFSIIGGDTQGIYVASLDSPERKRLPLETVSMPTFSAPDFLFFTRDRVLMAQRLDLRRLELVGEAIRVGEGVDVLGMSAAFSVSESGALVYWTGDRTITQPTWFQRDGTAVGTLGPPAPYMNLTLSSDGQQAAIDRFDQRPGIWLLDRARGTIARETSAALYESTPILSPKADSFVFAAARDTPPNLYVKRIGSTGEGERLFRSTFQMFPQSWSADGRFIAYVTVDPKTRNDIWVFPLDGERKATPFLQSQFNEQSARISPDGRWMAYTSDESGRPQVYVTRFPEAAGKWPVSTNGGNFSVWRRDSRELFYRAPDGNIMAVAIAPGADFVPGTPTALFRPQAAIGGLGLGTFYDVAPDGRFLVNIFVERTSPPATVVLNWTPP